MRYMFRFLAPYSFSIASLLFCSSLVHADDKAHVARISRDYVLQPTDLIHFEVYQEADMTLDVRVSQDYTLQLPLIGVVSVRGETLNEASLHIKKLYQNGYLRDPQIALSVKEYAIRSVNVLGSVTSPGIIKFQPEKPLTLIEAIAGAGGFTRLADRRKVKLTRSDEHEVIQMNVIDVDALIEGNNVNAWVLRPGDVIFVPERVL